MHGLPRAEHHEANERFLNCPRPAAAVERVPRAQHFLYFFPDPQGHGALRLGDVIEKLLLTGIPSPPLS